MNDNPRVHPLLPTLVFAALFVFSATLMVYVAWPFRIPLFLAGVMASICFSQFQRASARIGGRPRITAALFTLAFLVLLIGPLATIGIFAAQQTVAGFAFVHDKMGVRSLADLNTDHLPPMLAGLAEKIGHVIPVSQVQVKESFDHLERSVQGAVPQVLGASSRIVFHSLIMLFAFYFFLVDAPRLLRWLWQISPLENRQTQELLSDFQKVLKATFVGLLATAAIQGVLITAAYSIAGVPFPLFFGLMTIFGLFVPVIGTALVWVPVTGLLAVTGHLAGALTLFVFCLIVALVTENLVKPLIMRGQIEMHIGLIFISVLGGIGVFGLVGILTGPLVATFFLAMLRLYQRDYAPKPLA